jgi:hypothetical protein
LITIKFMLDWLDRPMQVFGRLGMLGLACGATSAAITVAMKVVSGTDMTGNPLLLLTVLSTLLGVQFICIGLLSEVIVRLYYGSRNSRHYGVRDRININEEGKALPFRAHPSQSLRRSA